MGSRDPDRTPSPGPFLLLGSTTSLSLVSQAPVPCSSATDVTLHPADQTLPYLCLQRSPAVSPLLAG